MPRVAGDYSKTSMYKIVCKNPEVHDLYVGSTTNFNSRKALHKHYCNKKFDLKLYNFINENGGWDNWNMTLIEEGCFNDGKEAITRERFWYDELKATLNSSRPHITDEELKEKNMEYQKVYRQVNKERLRAYYLEWKKRNRQNDINKSIAIM